MAAALGVSASAARARAGATATIRAMTRKRRTVSPPYGVQGRGAAAPRRWQYLTLFWSPGEAKWFPPRAQRAWENRALFAIMTGPRTKRFCRPDRGRRPVWAA